MEKDKRIIPGEPASDIYNPQRFDMGVTDLAIMGIPQDEVSEEPSLTDNAKQKNSENR